MIALHASAQDRILRIYPLHNPASSTEGQPTRERIPAPTSSRQRVCSGPGGQLDHVSCIRKRFRCGSESLSCSHSCPLPDLNLEDRNARVFSRKVPGVIRRGMRRVRCTRRAGLSAFSSIFPLNEFNKKAQHVGCSTLVRIHTSVEKFVSRRCRHRSPETSVMRCLLHGSDRRFKALHNWPPTMGPYQLDLLHLGNGMPHP